MLATTPHYVYFLKYITDVKKNYEGVILCMSLGVDHEAKLLKYIQFPIDFPLCVTKNVADFEFLDIYILPSKCQHKHVWSKIKVSFKLSKNNDENQSFVVTRPFSYEVDGLSSKPTTLYDFDEILALEKDSQFETPDFFLEADGFKKIQTKVTEIKEIIPMMKSLGMTSTSIRDYVEANSTENSKCHITNRIIKRQNLKKLIDSTWKSLPIGPYSIVDRDGTMVAFIPITQHNRMKDLMLINIVSKDEYTNREIFVKILQKILTEQLPLMPHVKRIEAEVYPGDSVSMYTFRRLGFSLHEHEKLKVQPKSLKVKMVLRIDCKYSTNHDENLDSTTSHVRSKQRQTNSRTLLSEQELSDHDMHRQNGDRSQNEGHGMNSIATSDKSFGQLFGECIELNTKSAVNNELKRSDTEKGDDSVEEKSSMIPKFNFSVCKLGDLVVVSHYGIIVQGTVSYFSNDFSLIGVEYDILDQRKRIAFSEVFGTSGASLLDAGVSILNEYNGDDLVEQPLGEVVKCLVADEVLMKLKSGNMLDCWICPGLDHGGAFIKATISCTNTKPKREFKIRYKEKT
jgi:RimJ/RimL family protein N-acetyltransferase